MAVAQIILSPQVVVLGTQETGFTVHLVPQAVALTIAVGIQGPTGADGEAGPAGPAGEDGPQGPPGPMPTVTGSGFAHVTVGAWDAAARNPTKSEVGLGNVTDDAQVKRTEMATALGVATLDAAFKLVQDLLGMTSAYLQPANPANLTSGSYTHFGLGAGFYFTPLKTGKVRFTIKFFPSAVGTGSGMNNYRMSYGTGVAPANGAAATGTLIGRANQGGGAIAVASTPPTITWDVILTGLVVGTQYWIDVQGQKAVGFTSMGANNIEATQLELSY
jgi:hypothetical protein